MKKYIILITIGALLGLGIYKYGVRDLFTLGAVKKVRKKEIGQLNKEVVKAEKRYAELLKTVEQTAQAYEQLGKAMVKRRNWTPSITTLKKAIATGAISSSVHHSIAVAYANRGTELNASKDYESAKYHYRLAMKKNPQNYDSFYGLSILLFYKTKEKKEAVKLMRHIMVKAPQYYDAQVAMARFYYEEKRYSRALTQYEDLYNRLKNRKQSPRVKAYRKLCSENISKLMMLLNEKKRKK